MVLWSQPSTPPSVPSSALACCSPTAHSFHSVAANRPLSKMYKGKKFLMSYPQPSSLGTLVTHAIYILIYHQQERKHLRTKEKKKKLLEVVLRVINQRSFVPYRPTS